MSPPPVDASLDALVGQVADEFTQRLNRGERPTVEEYVARYPEIADVLRQVLPTVAFLRQPEVGDAMAANDPFVGTTLGDFKLVREIGHGGMGIVYEALQLILERRVAVKILPAAAAANPRLRQRFKIEAMAAGSMHHEHIVPVHHVGYEYGVHFYAMDYIDGKSLAAIIKELRSRAKATPADPEQTGTYVADAGTATAAETETPLLTAVTAEGWPRLPQHFHTVAQLGLEAANALEHVHQKVVWHRDIKPGNLLVDSQGKLWIADFGLAHMRQADLSISGELLGTIRYMSPEQVLAKRVPIDHHTDIYSLGATLYELLTLEPVFAGNDRSEVLRQIMFDDPRPPRHLNPHVPRDLETIVLTALAKAPADRYATARALAQDLQRFLTDQPIQARPEGWPRWLGRRLRRHARGIALGLATAITTVVLSLLLLQLSQPTPEELASIRREQALTALTQELDLGRKVTLIAGRGAPGYFRWRTDEKPGKVLSAEDGEFTIQNWEHGLLELLPDPRCERYRFSAEVRHERQADHQSRVGIYFGHSEHPDGDSVAHFHCNVAFNELVDLGVQDSNGVRRSNPVGLEAHSQSAVGIAVHKAYFHQWDTYFVPAQPRGAVGPWRQIAVEIRPASIKVHWQKSVATIPRPMVKMMAVRPLVAKLVQPMQVDRRTLFAMRDGLGLYVSLGVASFRNVVVEPLNDEQ